MQMSVEFHLNSFYVLQILKHIFYFRDVFHAAVMLWSIAILDILLIKIFYLFAFDLTILYIWSKLFFLTVESQKRWTKLFHTSLLKGILIKDIIFQYVYVCYIICHITFPTHENKIKNISMLKNMKTDRNIDFFFFPQENTTGKMTTYWTHDHLFYYAGYSLHIWSNFFDISIFFTNNNNNCLQLFFWNKSLHWLQTPSAPVLCEKYKSWKHNEGNDE